MLGQLSLALGLVSNAHTILSLYVCYIYVLIHCHERHVQYCTYKYPLTRCTVLHSSPGPLQKADADKSGSLSFDEFAALFKELSHRPEIEVLFTKYASSHDYMTAADLRMFLMGEQSACPSLEDCQKLVECYEPTDEGKASSRMSLDGEQSRHCSAVMLPAEMVLRPKTTKHMQCFDLPEWPLCS